MEVNIDDTFDIDQFTKQVQILKEQNSQLLLENKTLAEKIQALNSELDDIKNMTDRCSAFDACKNKAHDDSLFCVTHKCEYTGCIESKQLNTLGKVLSKHCHMHNRFWKRV